MSEISTRIWVDERLWDQLRSRAQAEGTTVRELIPLLVHQAVVSTPVRPEVVPPATAASREPSPPAASDSTIPVVPLSETYQCGICGAQVRLGGLSNHLGRHLKEQQASDTERS